MLGGEFSEFVKWRALDSRRDILGERGPYEKWRSPQIRLSEKIQPGIDQSTIHPESVTKVVSATLLRAIENAPVALDDMKGVGPNSIVIRLPEDSHLIPILEREMFREYFRIIQESQTEGNSTVGIEQLMGLDQELAKITVVGRNKLGDGSQTATIMIKN